MAPPHKLILALKGYNLEIIRYYVDKMKKIYISLFPVIKVAGLNDVVLGKSCSQAKHTAAHVLPGQKMPPQVLPGQQMPKATFSQSYNYFCVRKRLIDT